MATAEIDDRGGAGTPGRAWLAPLLLTLAVQSVASFLLRLPPTVGPILTAERGVSPAAVGYLSGAAMIGSMLFLLAGAPLMERVGSVRTLQIGLVAGAFGVALMALPSGPVLIAAVVLMGLGYGPSTPAGSDILHRFVPPHRQALVFSIKQAGVPIGGVLAGLILPPLVEHGGLTAALAVSALIALATVLAVQPVRRRVDPAGPEGPPLTLARFLSPDNLLTPILVLRSTPGLVRLALSGLMLAVSQGVWIAFLVTILVDRFGLGLIAAGGLFAIMQTAGIVGRIGLGWIADRIGSGTLTLRVAAGLSAACTLALALLPATTPIPLVAMLCTLAGATVTGWNGVQIAEVARISPRGRVRETAAGATLLLFTGYVLGPMAFALAVSATHGYAGPLLAVALLTAVSALVPRGTTGATVSRP